MNVMPQNLQRDFYMLRDSIALFSHSWLGIEEEIYARPNVTTFGSMDLYNEEVFWEALSGAWSNPQIMDDYIAANANRLPAKHIEIAKTWKNPLTQLFTVFIRDGQALFMLEGHLFEVTGLTEPIKDMLKGFSHPCMLQTTLLPYEGMVVYDGLLRTMPVDIGPTMMQVLEEGFEEVLKENNRVSTAEQLMEVAPRLQEEMIRRETELMFEELERDEQLKHPSAGTHRGVLVGLSEEERKEAIHKELNKYVSAREKGWAAQALKKDAIHGTPTRALVDLIARDPKKYLQRWALLYGVKTGSKTKKDLAQALAPKLSQSHVLTEAALRGGISSSELAAYRSLFEAGGELEVAEVGLESLAGLPPVVRTLSYLFYVEGATNNTGTFVYVIPHDMMDLLKTFDWDELALYAEAREAAAHITDAVVELRGLVPMHDAYKEYERFYSHAFDYQEFSDIVIDAIDEEMIGCYLLEDEEVDEQEYLLTYDLAGFWLHDMGYADDIEDEDDDEWDSFLVGPLGPLEAIVEHQKGKKPRPLEEGMLTSYDLARWKEALPATRALRDFLDNNVPDDANDYFYADKVIEELISFMSGGFQHGTKSIDVYFEILENNGFVADEAHLHRVIELLMNMANSIPCWTNNGWAPNELMEKSTGRKQFYNPDGSVMKVGRNDPCPCGSGKKYKRCCGRSGR